ncbi:MAG: DUF6701 domain-containing protein [Gammaproteobacteria bacterium]
MRHLKTLSRQNDLCRQRLLLACYLWLCVCAAQAATYSSAATTFSWIDPTTHTAVVWTNPTQGTSGICDTGGDDSVTTLINIGFTFNFGGVNYTQLRIMSNGRVQFNNTYCYAGSSNSSATARTYTLPYADANLTNTMKVYGADIDTTPNGSGGGPGATTCPPATCSVRYTVTPLGTAPNRKFVVTWVYTPDWGSAGSYFNFQVILNEDGSFIYQYGPSNNPDNGHADVGWEVATTDYGLYTYTNIGALANTAIRFFIPVTLAEYRLEEGAWSGANRVVNTTSASFYGTPSGAVAPTANGYICRGASIPLNTAKGTVDAINSNINVYSNMGSTGSVSFWYKGNAAWNDGNDRMLLDATANNSAPFFFMKRTDGSLRFVLQDSANNIFVTAGGTHNFAANTWHHIAVTWSLGASARMSIYLDGALDKQSSLATSSSLSSLIGTLFIGDNQGNANSNNPTDNSANGTIDEVRVYNYEIPLTVVNRDYLASHPCASALNNFLISVGAAAASTCQPKSISITARDASNATLTTYTGAVNLSISTAHGDWSKVTANGTLTNGAADSGAASYTFVGADNGTITLALSDTHADDLTLGVNDASAGVSATSSTLNFRDNAFVITPTDALGTNVVAGRSHAMKAELWRKDLSTGNCSIATAYAGTKSLKAWLTRDAVDPGGAAPTITSVAPPTLATASLPNTQPGAANFSLSFTAGVANFTLGTSDVGKYALNLLDDSRAFATGVDILGASSLFTARPFGLAFTNIKFGATTNPGGANPNDAVFIAAGRVFQATVAGYLWQQADDTNNDGVPDNGANITDNGVTAHFAWPVSLSAQLNTPTPTPIPPTPPGTLGILGGTTSIATASFSGGAATVSDLTYSEVGSMKLSANASNNYLNSSGVNLSVINGLSITSGVIGRFTPDHFMTSVLVNGSLNNGCGSFTYSGQQSGGRGAIRYLTAPQFTITAQSATSTTTVNYTDKFNFRKLVASGVNVAPSLVSPTTDFTKLGADGINKVKLTANLNTGTLTDNGNGTLTYVLGNDDFAYTHEPNSQVTPFTSDIRLDIKTIAEPAGADGISTTITGQTLMPAGVEIRFGRLNLQNAYGSELLPLPISLTAEYYAGSTVGFTTNTDDGCMGVAAGNVTLVPNGVSTTLTVVKNPFVAGSWHAPSPPPYSQLSAPGNTGYVDLTADLGTAGLDWLQYPWTSPTVFSNPTARAVFGIFKGPDRRIYLRERFN